jgi:hypothetical protein
MRVPNEIAHIPCYTGEQLNLGFQESSLIPFDKILKFNQVPSKYIQSTCDTRLEQIDRNAGNNG